MKKTIFTLLLLSLMAFSANAKKAYVDGICYNLDSTNQTAEVTYSLVSSYSGNISIPSTITFYELAYCVTSIGKKAFSNSQIVSVNIPSSIKRIGDYAFSECSRLSTINISNNLNSIGDHAFWSCPKLTSIVIPDSLTYLGKSAFEDCKRLTSATIPNDLTVIDQGTFRGCSNLQSVTFGNSVANIGESAFEDCKSLASVIVPDNVKVIGNGAFRGCSSLASAIIGSGMTSIGESAFEGCISLTSAIVPDNVTVIGNGAFRGCSSLASAIVGNSVTSIGESAFEGCKSLISVIVPDNVTVIGNGAFRGCSSLASAIIGNSVTSIGARAFNGCSSLTSITIPDGVTDIGSNAFLDCTGLTSLAISNRITSIRGGTFDGCSGLLSVTIPYSVTGIGARAFNGCSSLTSITIPDGVADMGDCAFQNCYGLTSVTISNRITSIRGGTFQNCSGLLSITIPDSVTSIGANAFRNCSSLASITIPDRVAAIGNHAFFGCSKLISVTAMNPTPITIDESTFSNRANAILVVPVGSQTAYFFADYWRDFDKVIEMGADPDAVFHFCPDDNHPHAIDLGLPSGMKWACCNIGAVKPEESGGYYSFGETEEKKFYSPYCYTLSNGRYSYADFIGYDISRTPYDVALVNWDGNWQMPSLEQMNELKQNTTYQSVVYDDIPGGLFVGSNGNVLFMPFSGEKVIDQIENKDTYGMYWTSIGCYSLYSNKSYSMNFSVNRQLGYYLEPRCYGLTIRPVMTKEMPDSFTLSSTKMEILCGEADSLFILSGGGEYIASSSSGIITTVLKGNKMVVHANDTGDADIFIKDVRNLVDQVVNVHVAERLVFPLCKDNNHPHIVDLGLPSGTKWACCNVGAVNPLDPGGFFAYGETEEKGEYYSMNYIYGNGEPLIDYVCYDIGDNICGTQYDVAHVRWGGAWQMPTLEQIQELVYKCSYKNMVLNNNKYGCVTGPNGCSLAFPITNAGPCFGDELYYGDERLMWAGTVNKNDHDYYVGGANVLKYSIWGFTTSQGNRHNGLPVRPVVSGTSDMANISEQDKPKAGDVYNIYGIKVADKADNLPSGIYIVNGKKMVIK